MPPTRSSLVVYPLHPHDIPSFPRFCFRILGKLPKKSSSSALRSRSKGALQARQHSSTSWGDGFGENRHIANDLLANQPTINPKKIRNTSLPSANFLNCGKAACLLGETSNCNKWTMVSIANHSKLVNYQRVNHPNIENKPTPGRNHQMIPESPWEIARFFRFLIRKLQPDIWWSDDCDCNSGGGLIHVLQNGVSKSRIEQLPDFRGELLTCFSLKGAADNTDACHDRVRVGNGKLSSHAAMRMIPMMKASSTKNPILSM